MVVDFIAKSEWGSSSDIGIVGLSIGGGAAINAAGWDARIKSVVTVGAISHPVVVMNYEFQKRSIPPFVAAILLGYMRLRFGIDFDKIAPVKNIPNAKSEILIIHGDQDETIPIEQGRALETAGKAGKTHLWVVPDKGHSDCNTHPQFWEKVGAFLQAALRLPKRGNPLPRREDKSNVNLARL